MKKKMNEKKKGIEPLMTRAEVKKVGVTHTFSTAKAHRDLGIQFTCFTCFSKV
jgi:hypothetical protein